MALNTGQINVGGTTHISWGTQSPAADAVPLPWLVNDYRFNLDHTTLQTGTAGWTCTVAGTPGTWVAVA